MPPQESCHPGAQKCGSHSHKPYCHAQNNKNTPKNLKTEDAVQPLESKTKAYIHAGDAKQIRTYLDENVVAYLQQSTLSDAHTVSKLYILDDTSLVPATLNTSFQS